MKRLLGLILVLIAAIFIAGCCSSSSNSSQTPAMSVSQIKTSAESVPYDTLFRENEKHVGKIVQFRGKIEQAVDDSRGNYVFRIATDENEYLGYSGDIIWVNYNGQRYIEGDIIDVWGKVVGLKKYEGVLGNEVTIPEVNALNIELVENAK